MSSAGRWVLGVLLLLVGAVAVARAVSSDGGSQAGTKDPATLNQQNVSDEEALAAANAASGDVACKKPCIDGKELVDEAVTTAKLAPGSVTLSKLAFDVPNLTELQAEIAARQNAERTLQQALSNAAANSQSADAATLATAKAALDAAIGNEKLERQNADTDLTKALDQEKIDRASGDTTNKNAIDAEITARIAAVALVTTNLNTEIAKREAEDLLIRSNLMDLDEADVFMQVNNSELLNQVVDNRVLAGNAVTTDKIANETILSEDIKNGTIVELDLASGSVTGGLLGTITDDSIDDNDIVDDSLTAASLATGSVESDEIADGEVKSVDIGTGEVKTINLADASIVGPPTGVTTAKIQNKNVTTEKLADLAVTTDKLAGTDIANGVTGAVRAVTATALADGAVTNRAITNGAIALAKLDTDIATQAELDAEVAALEAADLALAGDIATNAADIATNAADIATNTADIATNAADIATNTADISSINATLGELESPTGSVNDAGNKVHWDALKGVPTEIIDREAADVVCAAACIEDGEIATVGASKLTGSAGDLDADLLADGAIKGSQLSDLGDITTAPGSKIALGTITGQEPADNTAGPAVVGNIALKTIGADNLADGAVTSDKLTANTAITGTLGLVGVPMTTAVPADLPAATTAPDITIDDTSPHKLLISGQAQVVCTGCPATGASIKYRVVRSDWDGAVLSNTVVLDPQYEVTVTDSGKATFPVSLIDTPAPGRYVYQLRIEPTFASGAVSVEKPLISAVDLGR